MDKQLKALLNAILSEDIPTEDVTGKLILEKAFPVSAILYSKDDGIFFGKAVIQTIFELIDPNAIIDFYVDDSQKITPKSKICLIKADMASMLKAERTMLNLVQRLSGVATTTQQFVQALNDPSIQILDTRKTTPLLRFLEKKAVVAGGGSNHRDGLSDMVLIKENHLSCLASQGQLDQLASRIKAFKKEYPNLKIELEVETLEQLRSLPIQMVDIVMFDNFSIPDVQKGIEICRRIKQALLLEVSGNISLENINHYQGLDIDRISIGKLTHSVKALDLSLRFC